MLTIIFGVLLGILICQFIPPKELAVKTIVFILKVCDAITKAGKEQLEKIEKENEQNRDSSQDQRD